MIFGRNAHTLLPYNCNTYDITRVRMKPGFPVSLQVSLQWPVTKALRTNPR